MGKVKKVVRIQDVEKKDLDLSSAMASSDDDTLHGASNVGQSLHGDTVRSSEFKIYICNIDAVPTIHPRWIRAGCETKGNYRIAVFCERGRFETMSKDC